MVTVSFGATENEYALDGYTVASVRSNPVLTQLLGLNGQETAEVSDDGGDSWRTVTDTFELADGDHLRFTRQSGTKG